MSWSNRTAALGYLKVETENLTPASVEGSPVTGLLTPVSSARNARHSSIASANWSFMSHGSSATSNASSVSSFQSSYLPSTPCHDKPLELSFCESDTALDSFNGPHLRTPTAFHAGVTQDSLCISQDSDWDLPSEWSSNQFQCIPSAFDEHLQAEMVFNARTVAQTSDEHHLDASFWEMHQRSTFYPTETSPYEPSAALGYTLPTSENAGWLRCGTYDGITVSPTEVAVCGLPETYDFAFRTPPHQSSSPCRDREWRFASDAPRRSFKAESSIVKEECAMDLGSPTLVQQHLVPKSNVKRGKKDRQRCTRNKRKLKERSLQHYADRGVEVISKSTKHYCAYVLENGEPCRRPFKKVEHLRRHAETHTGQKPYTCFFCNKPFGRQDNKRDHYKTHLSDSSAGRNCRVDFEAFYEMLRVKEDSDEVEKTMAMLEKWRENGGHKKKQQLS